MNETNYDKFKETLTKHYTELFKDDPQYQYFQTKMTPEALAERMTNSLAARRANKDGEGIKRTCKELGIKHTYTEIENYLNPTPE